MTAKRIVTVTLNPALDMTGAMGELKPGAVNLIQRSNLNPGGKGVNVAKVLAELGAEVSVTGFLGDDNQDPFAHLFEQKGIEDRFVRVHGASRINVKLVEETGRVTDLNFPGVEVSEQNIAALEETLLSLAENHDLFVIAGSLPGGLSPARLATGSPCSAKKVRKSFSTAAMQHSKQVLKLVLHW